MGSSHFGEMGMGSGRSGSSRRGKKNSTDKPKQPQRGLGIAQLEKIRLHNQIAGGAYVPSPHGPPRANLYKEDASLAMTFSSSPSSFHGSSSAIYGFHPNFVMAGYGEVERRDVAHGEPQSSRTLTGGHSNASTEHRHLTRPTVTLPLLRQPMEQDWTQRSRRQEYCDSMCSSSQNSDESDTVQELDLELKLSL